MQWLIIARDGTDAEAQARRQAARPAHLDNAARLRADGHLLVGGALTDDAGNMIGSAAVAQFATRRARRLAADRPLRHRRGVAGDRGAAVPDRPALRLPALPGRAARAWMSILAQAPRRANALRNPLATR